jgi:hypothetical protein
MLERRPHAVLLREEALRSRLQARTVQSRDTNRDYTLHAAARVPERPHLPLPDALLPRYAAKPVANDGWPVCSALYVFPGPCFFAGCLSTIPRQPLPSRTSTVDYTSSGLST